MGDPLHERALSQAGVISRPQAKAAGLTATQIDSLLAARRWLRMFRGVYALPKCELSRMSVLWAVVLRMGEGAVLSHHTAAELHGLTGPSRPVHITVPANRKPLPLPGVRVHRSRRVAAATHPSRTPPQTTVDETVVDLTQIAPSLADAEAWLATAIGARLTTPARLAAAMADRAKLRWRRPLARGLNDAAHGCHSALELRFLRDVERAHGLPPGDRQVRRVDGERVLYDDVVYRKYRTAVELDGRRAHPDRFRDWRRDNRVVAARGAPLRYGYEDVEQYPCQVAVQLGGVLRDRGWRGRVRRCRRPTCVVPPL